MSELMLVILTALACPVCLPLVVEDDSEDEVDTMQ